MNAEIQNCGDEFLAPFAQVFAATPQIIAFLGHQRRRPARCRADSDDRVIAAIAGVGVFIGVSWAFWPLT